MFFSAMALAAFSLFELLLFSLFENSDEPTGSGLNGKLIVQFGLGAFLSVGGA